LKWEVDSDTSVRAAIHALRNRGLTVFNSFVPRIRIRLHSGEDVVASREDVGSSDQPAAAGFESINPTGREPVTQRVRDAASAVVGASLCCHQLNRIVNEVLRANSSFERMAAPLECAGYELRICLDLTTYARVCEQDSQRAQSIDPRVSVDSEQHRRSQISGKRLRLPLSGQDMEFLRKLRIKP